MTIDATPEPIIESHLGELADIVAAFVSNNSIPPGDLPALIASVHASFVKLSTAAAPVDVPESLVPAVPIKKSVSPDFLICLDDGKKLKTLKRHLATLGMTPHEYRAKWGLPSDYPMIAPAYSATRAALAKSRGLGRVGLEARLIRAAKTSGPAKPRGRPRKVAV